MKLKTILGMMVLSLGMTFATQASVIPIPTIADHQGRVELVAYGYCHRHPGDPACHQRHHRHHLPFWHFKYDKRFDKKVHKCRHNPNRKGCHRFCNINPRVCYG